MAPRHWNERRIELPDRGDLWVRHAPAPPGRPTFLLLHGWTATADINWGTSYEALRLRGGVVALDHRGHGRGLRRVRFSLEGCADDATDVARILGVDRAIAVGYSMGGAIAQIAAKRHPDLVRGVVLAATAGTFNDHPRERRVFRALAGLTTVARALPVDMRTAAAHRLIAARNGTSLADTAEHLRSHDWLRIAEAGQALGRFDSRAWLEELEVPVANVVTVADTVVSVRRQLNLAEFAGSAGVVPVHGGHSVPQMAPNRFVPRLLHAIELIEIAQATSAPRASAAAETLGP
ncbi:MAG: alpha/beta fold hydrolase [Actinomycetota bacterium]